MTYSVLQTMQRWTEALGNSDKGRNTLKNLRIALKLYGFEGLGYKTRKMKPSEFELFCTNLSLQQWVQILSTYRENNRIEETADEFGQLALFSVGTPATQFVDDVLWFFDQQFAAAEASGVTSAQTKRNYRSALGQYLKWIVGQVWWQELFPEHVPEVLPERPQVLKSPQFRKRGSTYRIREDHLPSSVQNELAVFKDFRITGGKKALRQRARETGVRQESQRRLKLSPVEETSFEHKEKQFILLFLGWCVNVKGLSLDSLSLICLTDINLLQDYVDWLVEDRQCTHAVGIQIVSIGIAIAKWKNYIHAKRRNWSDIELIEELRDLQSFYHENYYQEKQAYLEKKWSWKELTHEEARQVVQYLRQLCAPHCVRVNPETGRHTKGMRRADSTLFRAWQTYLLVKLLVYLPVRQQEIRQLKLGQTLLREIDEQGKPFYVALIVDHKLKSKTQKNRRYKLPAILTQDLDEWVQTWRTKAAQAVTSLDNWLTFWGYYPEQVERLQQQSIPAQLENDSSENYRRAYIKRIEGQSKRFQTLIATWESTKFNFESDAPLFFQLGNSRSFPEKFGQPLSRASVHHYVRYAIAKATTALFRKPRWTNPHALRHIAAKHIRQIQGDSDTLAKLMGHSTEMADAYAEQILSEYEETQDFVDHWWEST